MPTTLNPDFSNLIIDVSGVRLVSDGTILSSADSITNQHPALSSYEIYSPAKRTVITPTYDDIRADIVLAPKGTGALLASVAGIQRGNFAVDLQVQSSGSIPGAVGDYSNIGGGNSNTSSGPYSNIGGGLLNRALAESAVVVGGTNNTASGKFTAIGGGQLNTNSGENSVIAGGKSNTVVASECGVFGGINNTITPDAKNTFIIGSNITSSLQNFTCVNNLSAQSKVYVQELYFPDGTKQTTALKDSTSNIGFMPIQQGGGVNQGSEKIYIGYGSNKLLLQVNTTDFQANWPINITGTASTSTSSLSAVYANNVVNGFYKTGGDITGSVSVSGEITALSGIRFRDGTVIKSGAQSRAYITLLGEQRGATNTMCAATSEGEVLVWGHMRWLNRNAVEEYVWPPRLLQSHVTFQPTPVSALQPPPPPPDIQKILCFKRFILILKTDGTLWTAGHGAVVNDTLVSGFAANSTQIPLNYKSYLRKVNIPGDKRIRFITAFDEDSTTLNSSSLGFSFNIAVIDVDNNLWMWGTNTYGSCGFGHTRPTYTPQLVFANVKEVQTRGGNYSGFHAANTILITNTNEAWAAGQGSNGSLGTGSFLDSATFVRCKKNSDTFIFAEKILDTNDNNPWVTYLLDVSDRSAYAAGRNVTYSLGLTGVSINGVVPYVTKIPNIFNVREVKTTIESGMINALAIATPSTASAEQTKLFTWGDPIHGWSMSITAVPKLPVIVPELSAHTSIKLKTSTRSQTKRCAAVYVLDGPQPTDQSRPPQTTIYMSGTVNFAAFTTFTPPQSFIPLQKRDIVDIEFGCDTYSRLGWCAYRDTRYNVIVQAFTCRGITGEMDINRAGDTPTGPINLTNILI